MRDETINPERYLTGAADRWVALGLGLLLLACLPLIGWASGPFLSPWGWAAIAAVGLGGGSALLRWRMASVQVVWLSTGEGLEIGPGTRRRAVPFDAITKIVVRPSDVVTWLEVGKHRYRLSHRLVGLERLLDRLRLRRPDLFAPPGPVHRFRVSPASAAGALVLAGATGTVGVMLLDWQFAVGLLFLAAMALAVGRLLFFVPRAFVVGQGFLTEILWARRRTFQAPVGHEESFYAAGGAVFFRLRFDFGSRRVMLDESQLLDPLRPYLDWVVEQLVEPT